MWWERLPLTAGDAGPAAGYAAGLAAFPRPAQARWAGVYVAGLLSTPGRKTVRNLAAGSPRPPGRAASDPAQALHNFLTRSPWDDRRLLAAYRASLAAAGLVGPGDWVAHTFAIPKRGRRTVGVYRQLSPQSGRKESAQLAVFVSHVGPAGCFPLTVRLYLPPGWLTALPPGERAALPEPRSKGQVAVDLLDELLADASEPRNLVVAPELAAFDWATGLGGRPVSVASPDGGPAVARATQTVGGLVDALGLGDFAGRGWDGWHRHAALVLAAFGYRAAAGK